MVKRADMQTVLTNTAIGFGIFFLCGVYDVSRNRNLDASKVLQYFTGNGILTWILSPFNILMDVLSLPYINKGVYKLDDLPTPYRTEIQKLIDTAYRENLVEKLAEKTKEAPRTMAFFKWYGSNQETVVDIPAYHDRYNFVQTIGVSVFNRRESTSRHFGPLRTTLRVLYNVNDTLDESVHIDVGDVVHLWRDEKLFIFDDTLMHQSFNDSDRSRYCLFVDIVRPSYVPGLMKIFVLGVRIFLRGVNAIFYKNWKVLKK